MPERKHEIWQCWIALLLTAGEFGTAIWLVFYEGHIFALYLAITYAVRETSGGHHYHEIVVKAFHAIWLKKEHEYNDPNSGV